MIFRNVKTTINHYTFIILPPMHCMIKSTSLLTRTFCVDRRVISLIISINFSFDLSYSGAAMFSTEPTMDSILFSSVDLFDKSSASISNCLRSFKSLLFKKITAVSFVTRLSSYFMQCYSVISFKRYCDLLCQ